MSEEQHFRQENPLWRLTVARFMTFWREPEAVFWVFGFPVLLALALGIAFRGGSAQPSAIGLLDVPGADSVAAALAASPDLELVRLDAAAADLAMLRGEILVLVDPTDPASPVLTYDEARPETRLAHLATLDALERGAGREDLLEARSNTQERGGARYIDFLIPGLIGLNLMGTGFWSVGFPIANARQQRLLKRMVATPMRRSHYLLAFMLARLVWLVLEVVVLMAFAWIAFGVVIRGSIPAFALTSLASALSFSALGLLVASRVRTIEGVSGLMNFVMLPMWLLSGSFFSADRFPDVMQPIIRILPLTATNDALRAITNEGAGFLTVTPELLIIAAWGLVSFPVALRLFRWE